MVIPPELRGSTLNPTYILPVLGSSVAHQFIWWGFWRDNPVRDDLPIERSGKLTGGPGDKLLVYKNTIPWVFC
jgi:hypothetical protein